LFTVQERNRIRDQLLELAKADSRIVSAAFVGSSSSGGDRWSDLDLTFGISEEADFSKVLEDWTESCEKKFQAVKLFDLISGPSTYRVFLFSGNLQVDLSFTTSKEFGSIGPKFQILWGTYIERKRSPPPTPDYLFGFAVHHLVRARICIERGRLWQAEYWISEARYYALTLACLQQGLETANGRGFDALPVEIKQLFSEALVSSLTKKDLLRALSKTLSDLLLISVRAKEIPAAAKLQQKLGELESETLE
jgi:hypothetical protein